VDHLAGTSVLNRGEQLPLNDAVMGQLVLRHMHNDHTDLKLGKILLKLKTSINGYKHVKVSLCEGQSGPSSSASQPRS
jgi:hypothetical protein